MKKFLLLLGVAAASIFAVEEASAQIKAGEGQVSIAFESNNIGYLNDKQLVEFNPDNEKEKDFASHDYLKVDYTKGRFSAGVQVDGFLPAISGYSVDKYQQRDTKLTAFFTKYVQWEDQNWGVRLGDIYDQFGNGLIFRAYEERALGFNNSLAGTRAYYNFNNMVNVKIVAGMPRLYDMRSKTAIWGADLSLSISDMTGWYDGNVALEGSYVGKYQNKLNEVTDFSNVPLNAVVNMVSGRVNFEYAGFSLRGEYVTKLNADLYSVDRNPAKGNVINVDFGYSHNRFSVVGTFRRQENMVTPTVVGPGYSGFVDYGDGNVINYIPLLTRQHTYSLANLNPYRGCSVMTGGEIGGQLDVYYSLRNPKARGKYWNFHANFSMFNTLKHNSFNRFNLDEVTSIASRNAWVEFNFDVERQWNKTIKTTLLYAYQRWDEALYHSDAIEPHYYDSHIFVADVTYKINKKHSMRFEAQYLASDDYEGDWVAATIEYNLAPMFSFYVSDMWNCEAMNGNYSYATEKNYLMHYYQVGTTFTYKNYRAQLAYGRNRAGYVCSGGACRYQPAYTGFNLALTISF